MENLLQIVPMPILSTGMVTPGMLEMSIQVPHPELIEMKVLKSLLLKSMLIIALMVQ
jgi:hypothetical protein